MSKAMLTDTKHVEVEGRKVKLEFMFFDEDHMNDYGWMMKIDGQQRLGVYPTIDEGNQNRGGSVKSTSKKKGPTPRGGEAGPVPVASSG